MKKDILRIALSALILTAAAVCRAYVSSFVSAVLFAAAYLAVGYEILYKAGRNILRGRVFDENFLMAIASVGAFAIGEYAEAVFVMIFYSVGELFEDYAVSRSRRSIKSLLAIRPDRANVMRGGGTVEVGPDEVAPGELIVVRPGERIPLDGEIISGDTALDTAALTGESLPREVHPGDEILSGCINLSAVITVRAARTFHDSTVSRILELVENAASKKSRSENFISRFAAVYTPVVVIAAVLLTVVPSLFDGQWINWLYRALNFLVVSCPCALVISVPLSFFGGIGGASRIGVLIKGSNYLEALATAETVVFDKTGTLTKGSFVLSAVKSVSMLKSELLELAAYAQHHSLHPLAMSVKAAYTGTVEPSRIADVHEYPGRGVEIMLDGKKVLAGNAALMESAGISVGGESDGSVVHVAADGIYCGVLEFSDEIKPDAPKAVEELRKCGVRRMYMLSGDRRPPAEKVGSALALDGVYAELLPENKVETLEKLSQNLSPHGKLVFVGDGINDAPVLARADVGAAMGALGSDAAIESADVVIMNDSLSRLPDAIRIARRCLRIVRENIVFALAVKFLILALCAFGIVGMWAAVFGDVGVMVLAVANSLRCLKA